MKISFNANIKMFTSY